MFSTSDTANRKGQGVIGTLHQNPFLQIEDLNSLILDQHDLQSEHFEYHSVFTYSI